MTAIHETFGSIGVQPMSLPPLPLMTREERLRLLYQDAMTKVEAVCLDALDISRDFYIAMNDTMTNLRQLTPKQVRDAVRLVGDLAALAHQYAQKPDERQEDAQLVASRFDAIRSELEYMADQYVPQVPEAPGIPPLDKEDWKSTIAPPGIDLLNMHKPQSDALGIPDPLSAQTKAAKDAGAGAEEKVPGAVPGKTQEPEGGEGGEEGLDLNKVDPEPPAKGASKGEVPGKEGEAGAPEPDAHPSPEGPGAGASPSFTDADVDSEESGGDEDEEEPEEAEDAGADVAPGVGGDGALRDGDDASEDDVGTPVGDDHNDDRGASLASGERRLKTDEDGDDGDASGGAVAGVSRWLRSGGDGEPPAIAGAEGNGEGGGNGAMDAAGAAGEAGATEDGAAPVAGGDDWYDAEVKNKVNGHKRDLKSFADDPQGTLMGKDTKPPVPNSGQLVNVKDLAAAVKVLVAKNGGDVNAAVQAIAGINPAARPVDGTGQGKAPPTRDAKNPNAKTSKAPSSGKSPENFAKDAGKLKAKREPGKSFRGQTSKLGEAGFEFRASVVPRGPDDFIGFLHNTDDAQSIKHFLNRVGREKVEKIKGEVAAAIDYALESEIEAKGRKVDRDAIWIRTPPRAWRERLFFAWFMIQSWLGEPRATLARWLPLLRKIDKANESIETANILSRVVEHECASLSPTDIGLDPITPPGLGPDNFPVPPLPPTDVASGEERVVDQETGFAVVPEGTEPADAAHVWLGECAVRLLERDYGVTASFDVVEESGAPLTRVYVLFEARNVQPASVIADLKRLGFDTGGSSNIRVTKARLPGVGEAVGVQVVAGNGINEDGAAEFSRQVFSSLQGVGWKPVTRTTHGSAAFIRESRVDDAAVFGVGLVQLAEGADGSSGASVVRSDGSRRWTTFDEKSLSSSIYESLVLGFGSTPTRDAEPKRTVRAVRAVCEAVNARKVQAEAGEAPIIGAVASLRYALALDEAIACAPEDISLVYEGAYKYAFEARLADGAIWRSSALEVDPLAGKLVIGERTDEDLAATLLMTGRRAEGAHRPGTAQVDRTTTRRVYETALGAVLLDERTPPEVKGVGAATIEEVQRFRARVFGPTDLPVVHRRDKIRVGPNRVYEVAGLPRFRGEPVLLRDARSAAMNDIRFESVTPARLRSWFTRGGARIEEAGTKHETRLPQYRESAAREQQDEAFGGAATVLESSAPKHHEKFFEGMPANVVAAIKAGESLDPASITKGMELNIVRSPRPDDAHLGRAQGYTFHPRVDLVRVEKVIRRGGKTRVHVRSDFSGYIIEAENLIARGGLILAKMTPAIKEPFIRTESAPWPVPVVESAPGPQEQRETGARLLTTDDLLKYAESARRDFEQYAESLVRASEPVPSVPPPPPSQVRVEVVPMPIPAAAPAPAPTPPVQESALRSEFQTALANLRGDLIRDFATIKVQEAASRPATPPPFQPLLPGASVTLGEKASLHLAAEAVNLGGFDGAADKIASAIQFVGSGQSEMAKAIREKELPTPKVDVKVEAAKAPDVTLKLEPKLEATLALPPREPREKTFEMRDEEGRRITGTMKS